MTEIVMVTGAARRIGAQIARLLHQNDCNLILHYGSSATEAFALADELNENRTHSAVCIKADLLDIATLPGLVREAFEYWGALDVLINNAARFYPTPLESTEQSNWSELMDINLKAPFFLIQAAQPFLKQRTGCVVNVIDIHAGQPLHNHPVYCISKAGLAMLTRSLAKELAPQIRVNGVAPGAIMWPENGMMEMEKNQILERIPLKRSGGPEDIAKAVLYLIRDADYVTGEIITVDGGRSLFS